MTLLVRGDLVKFELADGSLLDIPDNYGLVHDVEGKLLDPCELILAEYQLYKNNPVNVPKKVKKAANAYFGSVDSTQQGRVAIPNGPWHYVGDVVMIYYARYGKKKGLYHHPFKIPVPLYKTKNGKAFKLSLPDRCVINERGFVWP